MPEKSNLVILDHYRNKQREQENRKASEQRERQRYNYQVLYWEGLIDDKTRQKYEAKIK